MTLWISRRIQGNISLEWEDANNKYDIKDLAYQVFYVVFDNNIKLIYNI